MAASLFGWHDNDKTHLQIQEVYDVLNYEEIL